MTVSGFRREFVIPLSRFLKIGESHTQSTVKLYECMPGPGISRVKLWYTSLFIKSICDKNEKNDFLRKFMQDNMFISDK